MELNPNNFQSELKKVTEYISSRLDVKDKFKEKYSELLDPILGQRKINVFKYELSIAKIKTTGKTVLDAGCGSGIYSILFLLQGASRVESIDFFPDNINSFTKITKQFSLPINPICCDIGSTPIQSESIDIIYCTEAISHFHEWDEFIIESNRLLKPGGQILISDWNNGACPLLRREVYNMWEESECGPFTADIYKPQQKNLPYLYRRWMIIRKNFCNLSDEDVFHLGLRTVGKGGGELLEICREYISTGILPTFTFKRGLSQRRPEDGQRNEEPVDPMKVASKLQKFGIKTKIYPYVGYNKSKLLPILNFILSYFGILSLFVVKKYIIAGTKS